MTYGRVVVPDLVGVKRLPVDRPIRLSGATADQFAMAVDPLPTDGPLVIGYRPTTVPQSASAIVAGVLDGLEAVARQLFPAWLPGAEPIDAHATIDRRAVRVLATRLASSTDHFGSFLAELADAALTNRTCAGSFSLDVRARGLGRVLRDSYGRDGLALVISAADVLSPDQLAALAAASEWLANHTPMGIWLIGEGLQVVDRFPELSLTVPTHLAKLPKPTTRPAPAILEYPPLAGKPAGPNEGALEAALTRCAWADGRTWNQNYHPRLLNRVIRFDLWWPTERCVVEVDGPEHRGASHYAADRRRDNVLQLDRIRVLRFTNEQVADDLDWVLGQINQMLTQRRDEGLDA